MVDTLTLAVQTYPNDQNYWTDLGIAQSTIGQLEPSLASHQKALALSPDRAITHVNLLNLLISLDRLSEAKTLAAQTQKLGMNDTLDMTNLYIVHAFAGDTVAMAQDVAAVRGRPDENNITLNVALLQEYRGEYAAADKTWRLCEQQCAEQKAGDAEAFTRLNRVSGQLMADLPVDTEAELKSAMALDQSKLTLLSVAEAAALAGLAETGAVTDRMMRAHPEDTLVKKVWGPCSRAALALYAHNPNGALQALNGFEAYDLVCPSAYFRGCAYLELKDGPNALEAFRRATKYRGAAVLNYCQDYGQAQLGMARAFFLINDKASAKKAYEDFFLTWKDADAALPQLVAAKKEYAALN